MGTTEIEIFTPEQMKHALEHIRLEAGDECPACHRVVPKEKRDDATGPRRSIIQLHEPKGSEGTLQELMIAVVDKYREEWPRDHAAMRQNIGLEVIGGRCWKYHAVHFSLYATLMVPGLAPVEED